MVGNRTWRRAGILSVGSEVALGVTKELREVARGAHVDRMGIGEMRVVGMLDEIMDASVELRALVIDRDFKVPVVRRDVQIIDRRRRGRVSIGVRVGLLLDVVHTLRHLRKQLHKARAEVRWGVLEIDVLEIIEIT